MTTIPRMRTVQQCAAYLKENDPDCCIGDWTIRKIIKQGKIPVCRVGKKTLVNLDNLLNYLSGEEPEQEQAQ